MSELEKLFEAIGNRGLNIRRRTEGDWRAVMRTDDDEAVGLGTTPSRAIHAALLLVLASAQEKEREMEDYARKARDVVAQLRSAVEGK